MVAHGTRFEAGYWASASIAKSTDDRQPPHQRLDELVVLLNGGGGSTGGAITEFDRASYQ